MKAFLSTFFVLLLSSSTYSQTDEMPTFEFFEGGLHFSPLLANTYEPRVGFIFQADKSDLRLDIGNSIDIVQLNVLPAGHRLTFGADFFTWTALRQDENFHFPVDAVDYLFGLNVSYSHAMPENTVFYGRVRWSHISAHLVDGRYDKSSGQWREDLLPRVYSREFIEATAAYDIHETVRPYLSLSYVYHIDPAFLGKMIYQGGIEARYPWIAGDAVHPYVAYDIRLVDIEGYQAFHSLQAGIKIGTWRGNGLNVFVAYYSGKSVHGEYFDINTEYWGPGFTIDF